jgi:copper chaperone NosL
MNGSAIETVTKWHELQPAKAAFCAGREAAALKLSRAMVYVAALLLLGAFVGPLWHYNFTGLEYPEGLPMAIYVNHLEGRIDIINELNHYIGMRKIEESKFPELSVMPWVVALLCVAGLGAAALRRRSALAVWLGLLVVTGLALLGDFAWRLYTYCHNLDPTAAIQVEPFMPRLVGSYHMMNFYIASYPGLGAIAMMASFGLGSLALVLQWRARTPLRR